MSSDLPGVNPATLNGILLYYRLMTKRSGLGDSTELSRVGLSQRRRARIGSTGLDSLSDVAAEAGGATAPMDCGVEEEEEVGVAGGRASAHAEEEAGASTPLCQRRSPRRRSP
jgi:hypothetical protein